MGQHATLSLALTDGPAVPDNRRLAIDLCRSDIETALHSPDDDLELLLDLEAGGVNSGATRRQTLAIGCTREDLERMLQTEGDNLSIGFDAEALAWVIDEPDIEAHGLREKMAVLAVVVATTGAAAGGAQAMPVHGGQGAGSGVTRDMPADSVSASVASNQGAPATRANPAHAAAAVAAASAASSTQLGPYSGGAPFQGQQETTQGGLPAHGAVLPSGHHAAPTVAIDAARDLPSDSVKASQAPTFAHGAAGAQASGPSSDDTSNLVIVGGITLALLGGALGAAAVASHRSARPI